jgi:hypothetical protein
VRVRDTATSKVWLCGELRGEGFEGTLGSEETGAGFGEGSGRRELVGDLRRPLGDGGGSRDGESGIWLFAKVSGMKEK